MAAKLLRWAEAGEMVPYTTWNRQNPLADPVQCGRYRPDFAYELPASVVLCEFDEEQHSSYPLRCELARMAEVMLGYGGCPVHWIRYNPDGFKVFGVEQEVSQARREAELQHWLRRALCGTDCHPITVTYICYSVGGGRRSLPNGGCSTLDSLVRAYTFETLAEYTAWAERWLAGEG